MLDRRRHERKRSFAAGMLDQGGLRAPGDCILRNISEGGALLLVAAPGDVMQDLVLAVAGEAMPARVVWRGEHDLGVAFVGNAVSTPTNVVSIADARRLRAGDELRLAERIARFVRHRQPVGSAPAGSTPSHHVRKTDPTCPGPA